MKCRNILKDKSEKLHTQFLSITEKLRESYLSFATPVFYTSHGIDHSQNIEEIVDRLILDSLKYEMNEQEIFILLCSIYFHDVGMALMTKDGGQANPDDYFKKVDEARRTHSEKTALFMIQNYEEFGLRKSQAEIIAWICKAHSDIKNEDGTKIYTFKEIMARSDVTNVDTTPIRIKYLAALLRLADELDVTAKRAPGKRMELIDLPFESQIEWMKHQIFSGVSINPKVWEIALDVSESLLYGGEMGKKKNEIALTNKLVTDSAIKIRKSLMEVKLPLLKEGLLYRKISFRDLMIVNLERIYKKFGLDLDGITFLEDAGKGLTDGSTAQTFLYRVEKLDLSPEYTVSDQIDDRLFQSVNFFSNFEHNFYSVGDHVEIKGEIIKKVRNSIIQFLGKYAQRRGFGGNVSYETHVEEYGAYLSSAGRYIIEGKRDVLNEFITELKFEIGEIVRDENLFDDWAESDISLYIKMVVSDIIKDLFLHERRRIMLSKSDYHHYFHIIPKTYFYNVIRNSILNPAEKDSFASDFKITLTCLKNLMYESGGNFKLYCHDGNVNLDYRIIASELVILPGRSDHSSVVLTETEAVIQFYDDFHRILTSDDTWLIEDIDVENYMLKLNRDEKIQGISRDNSKRDRIEIELNKLISESISAETNNPNGS